MRQCGLFLSPVIFVRGITERSRVATAFSHGAIQNTIVTACTAIGIPPVAFDRAATICVAPAGHEHALVHGFATRHCGITLGSLNCSYAPKNDEPEVGARAQTVMENSATPDMHPPGILRTRSGIDVAPAGHEHTPVYGLGFVQAPAAHVASAPTCRNIPPQLDALTVLAGSQKVHVPPTMLVPQRDCAVMDTLVNPTGHAQPVASGFGVRHVDIPHMAASDTATPPKSRHAPPTETKPVLQVGVHTPPVQATVPFGVAGQGEHEPQWAASLRVSISQPVPVRS